MTLLPLYRVTCNPHRIARYGRICLPGKSCLSIYRTEHDYKQNKVSLVFIRQDVEYMPVPKLYGKTLALVWEKLFINILYIKQLLLLIKQIRYL